MIAAGRDEPASTPASPGHPDRWELCASLFSAWREGDAHSMDELVRLMTPVLWQIARAYGLERCLAEDVVQTTWLRLIVAGDTIHEPRSVAAWLTTTTRREAWRTGRQNQRVDTADRTDLESYLPVQLSAEESASISEEASRLWRAVGTLAARCQRLLRIIAFEDRPDYATLAGDLSMPVGSIGPTRQRCLAKLRALLAENSSIREAS